MSEVVQTGNTGALATIVAVANTVLVIGIVLILGGLGLSCFVSPLIPFVLVFGTSGSEGRLAALGATATAFAIGSLLQGRLAVSHEPTALSRATSVMARFAWILATIAPLQATSIEPVRASVDWAGSTAAIAGWVMLMVGAFILTASQYTAAKDVRRGAYFAAVMFGAGGITIAAGYGSLIPGVLAWLAAALIGAFGHAADPDAPPAGAARRG